MATYNQIGLCPSGTPRTDRVFIVRGRADFRKTNCAASDSIKVATIPAGTLMIGGYNNCVTAEGAGLTVDIGTSAAGNQLDDAFSGNSVAGYTAFDTCTTEGDGFVEATADTEIFVTAKNAADVAVIDTVIFCALTTEDVIGS